MYIYSFRCDPFFERRKGSFQSATWNVEYYSVASHGNEARVLEEDVRVLVQLCDLVEWYARWKLWGYGLFVWSYMPARKFFKGAL